ncbi:MAG: PAS domain-containing protein [Steroidobacteraceae bacterium]
MEDLIVVFDTHGDATFTSASVGRILGYRPRELRLREVLRRVHPAHRRRAAAMIRRIGDSCGEDDRLELMIREAGGAYRWLEAAAVDLRDDPDVAGVLCNARDVTARKVAELERDAALDGASVFVWEQDLGSGVVRWLNQPDEPLAIGLLADADDDDSWYAAVHADDQDRVRRAYADFVRSALPRFEIGYRVRARDGGYRHVLDRCRMASDQSVGTQRVLRGVTIDVTDQRRMADDLARSRERFQLAIECAAIDYYEWFRDDDIVIGSDRILGALPRRQPGGSVRGAEVLAAMHPDDRLEWQAARSRHAAGEVEFAECRFRVRDSSGRWRWVFDRAQIVDRGPAGEPRRMVGIVMDIDHSQRAELALGEAEARLGTAVWAAHLGLWELDVQTRRAHWFSNWCELEDIDPCEGPDHVELWDANIHPDDLAAAAAQFADLLASDNDVYEAEYRVRTRSGEWRWIQERSRAVRRDAEGRPLRVVGTCMNIHARKVAEQALRDSQLRLQSIAVNSSDWLLLLDTSLTVVFVNRSIRGREPDQLVGRNLLEIVRPDLVDEAQRFYQRVLTSEGPCEMREMGDPVDGMARHMLVRAQAVRRGAQVVGVAVTATELTTVVRQQQLLELQALILDTMREGVVLITADGRIRLTNPAFDRLFNDAPGVLVDTPIGELLEPAAIDILRSAAHGSTPREFDCRRRDGTTFAAACVVTPIVIDGRPHLLAVLNDISERRVLEREILEVSNREQHRIGNDLHDGLGQELTGVALMLRALSTQLRRTQPGAMAEFDDIVELLNRSIHNTRTLARGLSPVSLERGGLLPALRTLATRSRDSYGIPVSMRTRVTAPLRLDEAACNHLYRIAQEAINNAMRHGKPSRIVLQLGVDPRVVRLSVHDNGRGLPPGGPADTGLGLRTMRYRAHVTGGDVLVENHRHGGTIVRCTVPHVLRDPQSLDAAHLRAHVRAHPRAHTRRGDPW